MLLFESIYTFFSGVVVKGGTGTMGYTNGIPCFLATKCYWLQFFRIYQFCKSWIITIIKKIGFKQIISPKNSIFSSVLCLDHPARKQIPLKSLGTKLPYKLQTRHFKTASQSTFSNSKSPNTKEWYLRPMHKSSLA